MNKPISVFLAICFLTSSILSCPAHAWGTENAGETIGLMAVAFLLTGLVVSIIFAIMPRDESGWIKSVQLERKGRNIKTVYGANVYKLPNAFSDVVGNIYINEEYRIIEEKNIDSEIWYKIMIDRDHLVKK